MVILNLYYFMVILDLYGYIGFLLFYGYNGFIWLYWIDLLKILQIIMKDSWHFFLVKISGIMNGADLISLLFREVIGKIYFTQKIYFQAIPNTFLPKHNLLYNPRLHLPAQNLEPSSILDVSRNGLMDYNYAHCNAHT